MNEDDIGDIDLQLKQLGDRKTKLLKLAALRQEVCDLEKNEMAGKNISGATIKIVAIETCSKFQVTFDRLIMGGRSNHVVIPRQVIFYVARELCDVSSTELGRIFSKDHGTVLYGVQQVKNRMDVDGPFASQVNEIIKSVRQRLAAETVSATKGIHEKMF